MKSTLLAETMALAWERAADALDETRASVKLTPEECRVVAAGLRAGAAHARCDDAGEFTEWRHVKDTHEGVWHLFPFDGRKAADSAHCDEPLPPATERAFMDRPESIAAGDTMCRACHDGAPESARAQVKHAGEMTALATTKKKRGRPAGSKTRKPKPTKMCKCGELATHTHVSDAGVLGWFCATHYNEAAQLPLVAAPAAEKTVTP